MSHLGSEDRCERFLSPGLCDTLRTSCSHRNLLVTMKTPVKKLPSLPIERALKVISGRWKAVILYHLLGGPKRLSEMRRLVPRVSQKVLVQQLRELEEHGLVRR